MNHIDWKNFYKNIREPGWPDCESFDDLETLPIHIQQKILFQNLGFLFKKNLDFVRSNGPMSILASTPTQVETLCSEPMVDYFLDDSDLELTEEISFQGIKLKYHPSMECGGTTRSPLFIEILNMIAPGKIFDHCLDWCSGPGFIGFGILGQGLCNKLDLADIWKPALKAAELVNHNYNVNVHHIRRLSDIQPIQLYDLVVGNPPWFFGNLLNQSLNQFRLTCDPGLQILRTFLIDVKNYLRPDGILILVQGQTYTGPVDFLDIVEQAGLQMSHVIVAGDQWHWFVIIEHKKPG